MDEKIHPDLEDFSEEPLLEAFIKEIQKEEVVFLIGICVAVALVILTVGKKQEKEKSKLFIFIVTTLTPLLAH